MQGVSGELDLKKLINTLMVAKAGPMTAASMARFLKALYRDSGVSNASSHSGRRTLITRLAERGIDLKAIAEIAGHSSIRNDGAAGT